MVKEYFSEDGISYFDSRDILIRHGSRSSRLRAKIIIIKWHSLSSDKLVAWSSSIWSSFRSDRIYDSLSLVLSSPVQILSGYERRGRGQGAIRLDRPAFYLSAIKGNIILFYFFCHQARRATVQASDTTRLVNDRPEKDKLPFLLTRTELFQEI